MTPAFHGDAAVQSAVIELLKGHAAAGTLSFGATRWDGTGGSTLGIAAESEDSGDYATRFGYPLALAGLLDPIVAVNHAGALDTAIAWHEHVLPGSDLSGVPATLLTDLLERLGAGASAPDYFAIVIDMHRNEARGDTASRTAWSRLREEIEARATAAENATRIALNACTLACWPLATSRSVLVGLVHAFAAATNGAPSPDFDEDDRCTANAILQVLWDETQPQRDAGDPVHLPTLFRARHPDLSSRFEADLARSNAYRAARAAQAQQLVLTHLAAAGTP
ncbi:hypothetical protein NPJ82_16595 (plasmid) [Sphingomonas sp. NY01]|uniref:hypothetical protein n=1 Tax=Sphingomonas sp. NY01 TaxID=2968057 RepID=UPI00315D00B2